MFKRVYLQMPIIKHILHGDNVIKIARLANVLSAFGLNVSDYDKQLDPVKPSHTVSVEM